MDELMLVRFCRELQLLLIVVSLAAAAGYPASGAPQAIARQDHRVPSDPDNELFLREVLNDDADVRQRTPVILVHGARVSSVRSFDLPVANGSLAADLARAGHAVYVMDVRGYGGSTRPSAMDGPRNASRPLGRSPVAVRDIGAVVDWVRATREVDSVALLGWATGGHLVHAVELQFVLIRGATHYVHLDRPERGRTESLDAVTGFLGR